MPSSAWRIRFFPSKTNGLVTTPTVSAPTSRASLAITGAPPVPVPPPMPAVMKIMSAPVRYSRSFASSSMAERLRVGVRDDEVDPGELVRDHRVDRVAAPAADADNLDARAQLNVLD